LAWAGWFFSVRIVACWLANPLFFTALVALLLGHRHLPWTVAVVALLCASLFDFEGAPIAVSLHGFVLPLHGYTWWLASMAMLTFTTVYRAVAFPLKPMPASR